jgi:hypothetical protein
MKITNDQSGKLPEWPLSYSQTFEEFAKSFVRVDTEERND